MEKSTDNIDNYIAAFAPDTQAQLRSLRAIIREEVPAAMEIISYGIPTFSLAGNIVHFAAYAHHIGFYPGASGIAAFAEQLSTHQYKYAKGSVQFPLDKPLPTELIRQIVTFRVAENLAKMSKKAIKNKQK